MKEVERILFPTDFSEASRRALPHAVEFSRRFGASITMLHIRTPFSDDPHTEEYQFFDEDRYAGYLQEKMQLTSQSVQGIEVHSRIQREVSPASGILEHADQGEFDIIIMGTHGRSSLGRFFLGSVTEKVVRHSRIPVLTVAPGREAYRDNPRYERILATYDFSPNSREAAVQASELAGVYRAELQILYVIEQEILPGYYEAWRQQVATERPNLISTARQSLLEVLGENGLEDVEVNVEVGDGDGRVHRDIRDFAVARQMDLIVMGTHGLSGVEHILLGSTTERLVRMAPCPVLTFRLPGC